MVKSEDVLHSAQACVRGSGDLERGTDVWKSDMTGGNLCWFSNWIGATSAVSESSGSSQGLNSFASSPVQCLEDGSSAGL